MSLFVLASKDGWVNIMYTGLDAVGVDQQVPRHYTDDALDARTPRSECDIEVLSLGQSQPVNQSINQSSPTGKYRNFWRYPYFFIT